MNVTARELRARAREQLGRSPFEKKWLMMVAVFFLVSMAVQVANSFVFLGFLLYGVAEMGLAYACLARVRTRDDVNLEEATYGCVKGRFFNSAILGFLISLFSSLWGLLFFVPGIVKMYAYSQAYYISIYNPQMDHLECITESRRMMKGNKWRLFCLDLSFMGWYILTFLFTMGIGSLWVCAYQRVARANFFEDLRTKGQQIVA